MKKIEDKITGSYPRFREWQMEPLHYENKSTGVNVCANCGTEFSDNFCPRCGQKADVGRITWESVRQSFMNLWGVGSRSFFYTLLQLLLRPGYLIRDYISGKRQVSYPPVKMLFFVAVAYLTLLQIGKTFGFVATEHVDDGTVVFNLFVNLFLDNPGWFFVLLSPLMIFPTWIIFRFAPGLDHHTLPEGFMIQVFMSTLVLMIVCLADAIWLGLGWLVFVYYFIAYKQLFGYGWWGTIWRTALCFGVFIGSVVVILGGAELAVTRNSFGDKDIASVLFNLLEFFLMSAVSAIAGYFISKATARK